MIKKTWVKVKRGLLDPKHREELGIRIWLYLYILDNANWDDGIIYDWTDGNAANEMSMPKATIRSQRMGLEESGYISCEKKQYSQKITVHNWTDPRKYDGKVINRKKMTKNQSDKFLSHQSDNQSDNQPYTEPITPTSTQQTTNNIVWIKITESYNLSPDVFYTLLNTAQQMQLPKLLEDNPDRCWRIAQYYINDGLSFNKIPGRIINKFDEWDNDNRPNTQTGKVDLSNA